jgi:hypothetical protein
LYTHVCKWKIIPVETTPGMGKGGIKENDGGGELNYDIFVILLRTFKNTTIYPDPEQQ